MKAAEQAIVMEHYELSFFELLEKVVILVMEDELEADRGFLEEKLKGWAIARPFLHHLLLSQQEYRLRGWAILQSLEHHLQAVPFLQESDWSYFQRGQVKLLQLLNQHPDSFKA